MLPDLESRNGFPAARKRLTRALRPGPWLWPNEEQAEALDFARSVTQLTPSSALIGCALGVTVRESAATLWAMTADAADDGVRAAGDVHASWRRVCAALPRALPVLGVTLRPHLTIPRIVRLAEWQGPGRVGFVPPETAVDGASFGLALFLVLASRVAKSPVPDDILACATIDALGTLGPVEALSIKVEAARQLAPRFKRLLVAAGQKEEAEDLMAGHGEVVSFSTAAEAARMLFEQALVLQLTDDAISDRELVVETIFRLVLSERLTCWSPVEKAAAMVQGRGPDYRLEFARAVAARHESNRGSLSFPPDELLKGWPRSLRLNVLAHVVQQAADCGMPDPAETLTRVQHELPRSIRDGLAAELRLVGAVARLKAFTGRHAEALADQRELALEHVDALDYQEVSRPLCEWLRLSAALENEHSFVEAVTLAGRLTDAAVLASADDCFLTLARARGRVVLRSDNVEDRDELQRLAVDASLPSHVRCSAARWYLAAARRAGARETDARNLLDLTCRSDEGSGTVFLTLAALDGALSKTDAVAAQDAVARLRSAYPGLVGNLTLGIQDSEQPAAIARFFPY